jgi:Flp pilus assembly protein TadG
MGEGRFNSLCKERTTMNNSNGVYRGSSAQESSQASESASFRKTKTKRSKLIRVRRLPFHGERGSAVVEMALVMPIMLMMLTGIFSFSVALYQKLQLAEAISNAARVMAAERGDTDPCATTASAIYAAAPSLSKSNLTLTFTLGGTNTSGTITGGTAYGGTKGTAPSCTAAGNGGVAAMQSGWPVQVQAIYPCTLSIYAFQTSSCSLGSLNSEVAQ